jgi:broad specificity phosphatase PhoE
MKSICIIRHGESLSQINKTVCGINPDLSEAGEAQSISLREMMKKMSPSLVLLSPLRRAYRTFILSELVCDRVEFDGRLLEGEWEEAPNYPETIYDGISKVAPIKNLKWHQEDFDTRVSNLVSEMRASDVENLLIFSHSGTINLILKKLLNVEPHGETSFQVENASLTKLELNGNSSLMTKFNETSHLR